MNLSIFWYFLEVSKIKEKFKETKKKENQELSQNATKKT